MEYVEGAIAQGPDRPRAHGRRGGRDRPPGARRRPLRARARDRPPRPEAAERAGRPRGPGAGSPTSASPVPAPRRSPPTGSVLGTAQYLSPEQAQGLEMTAASDLYSIGVMLYEALTGRVPFDAETPVAVALKQVSEQARPPSELNPSVPRCARRGRPARAREGARNRFASADEFLARPRRGRGGPLRRVARRHRLLRRPRRGGGGRAGRGGGSRGGRRSGSGRGRPAT